MQSKVAFWVIPIVLIPLTIVAIYYSQSMRVDSTYGTTPNIDSVSALGAANDFIRAKYVTLDFVSMAKLLDDNWLSNYDNRQTFVLSYKHLLENPEFSFLSERTTFSLSPLSSTPDSIVYSATVRELSFADVAKQVQAHLDTVELEPQQVEERAISLFTLIAQTSDSIPAAISELKLACVRRKCDYKVIPLSN